MQYYLHPAIISGFVAVAVSASSLLGTSSTATAEENINNNNQVAIVTTEITSRLNMADPIKGKKIFQRRCKSCHTLEQGGRNMTGPNLWNVVGRKLGSKNDFKYSSDMKTIDSHWGYEELDKFLTKPFKFIPSTRMTFPGLKKNMDRANLIAFLRSNSDNPQPLPSD